HLSVEQCPLSDGEAPTYPWSSARCPMEQRPLIHGAVPVVRWSSAHLPREHRPLIRGAAAVVRWSSAHSPVQQCPWTDGAGRPVPLGTPRPPPPPAAAGPPTARRTTGLVACGSPAIPLAVVCAGATPLACVHERSSRDDMRAGWARLVLQLRVGSG